MYTLRFCPCARHSFTTPNILFFFVGPCALFISQPKGILMRRSTQMHNIIDLADIFIRTPRRGVPYEIKNRKKICHTIYNEYSKEAKMHSQ